MILTHWLAIGSAVFWLSLVVLGFLGKRRAAALMACLVGIAVTLPFLPRLLFYVFDRDGFVIRYGTAAVSEPGIGGLVVALGIATLISVPLVLRRSRGWLAPALLSLFPVAFLVWLVCCLVIRF